MRRVLPLCADFCPTCEHVRSTTGKAHIAPTCGQCEKTQAQYTSSTQRSPAAAGKILPFGRSQHRIWLVAGTPAPCQMPQIGQKPIPTSYERRKYAKKQAIQYKNLGTGFRDNPPKSSTSPYEPERLCDRVLSRKTHRDS